MALNILQRVRLGNAGELEKLRTLVAGQGGELSEDETEWYGRDHSYTFVFPISRTPFTRTARDMRKQGWPSDENAYLRSSVNPNRGDIFLGDMSKFAEENKGKLLSREPLNISASY